MTSLRVLPSTLVDAVFVVRPVIYITMVQILDSEPDAGDLVVLGSPYAVGAAMAGGQE